MRYLKEGKRSGGQHAPGAHAGAPHARKIARGGFFVQMGGQRKIEDALRYFQRARRKLFWLPLLRCRPARFGARAANARVLRLTF